LQVHANSNAAMEFKGTYLEVDSYLFSSDVIPNILNAGNGHTAQY